MTTKAHGTGLGWRSCARSCSTTAATFTSTVSLAARRRALRGHLPTVPDRVRPAREPQQWTTLIFGDRVREDCRGGAGESRLEAAAAHPGAQHPRVVDGQRARVERLLASVRQRQPHATVGIQARRARDKRRVRDVFQVGEALLIETEHVAAVGRRQPIQPAKQGALQPLVRDLGALVNEAALAIDADSGAPYPLEPRGRVVARFGGRVGHVASRQGARWAPSRVSSSFVPQLLFLEAAALVLFLRSQRQGRSASARRFFQLVMPLLELNHSNRRRSQINADVLHARPTSRSES
jgi:hypothetical protein